MPKQSYSNTRWTMKVQCTIAQNIMYISTNISMDNFIVNYKYEYRIGASSASDQMVC